MFTVYGVYKNADETEGRGPMRLVLHAISRDFAVGYIEAQPDAWGRPREWRNNRYGDYELREEQVFVSFEDIKNYEADEPRRRALAKLTSEERRILGL